MLCELFPDGFGAGGGLLYSLAKSAPHETSQPLLSLFLQRIPSCFAVPSFHPQYGYAFSYAFSIGVRGLGGGVGFGGGVGLGGGVGFGGGVGLGGGETQNLRNTLAIGLILANAFLEHLAKFSPESTVLFQLSSIFVVC